MYTVRGKWILKAGDKRSNMEPGSLLWLRPGFFCDTMVPYDEPAQVLVFTPGKVVPDKKDLPVSPRDRGRYTDRMPSESAEFDLGFLSPDHPAQVYK